MSETQQTTCAGADCRPPLTAKEVREKLVELFCLHPVVVAHELLQAWLIEQERLGR